MVVIHRTLLSYLPPLHRAAGEGNLAELARLLDAGVFIGAPAAPGPYATASVLWGLTPLMVAAGNHDGAPALPVLLEHGADATARSDAGVDALWYAAATGDRERIATLLAAGCPADQMADDGRTALALAARSGSATTVRLLLEAGASPHPPAGLSGYGMSPFETNPLLAAVLGGSVDSVRMLLDLGALASLPDLGGFGPLMLADTPEMVALLVAAGCPRDARDMSGASALDGALMTWGRAAVVTALLDAGVDPNDRDSDGRTALLRYCQAASDVALIERLLAGGAEVQARDPAGRTALHIAAATPGFPPQLAAVVAYLVDAGIPVDARADDQSTPLHLAAAKPGGQRQVIGALLDLGADIEARDADGLTPLLLGARLERDGAVVVRQLLARGADVTARTAQDDSARDRAAAQIAAVEQQEAMAQQDGVATADVIAASAQRRLTLRSVRATVATLDAALGRRTPRVPEAAVALPAPVWLGYRREARAVHDPRADFGIALIDEWCSFERASYVGDTNDAACYYAEDAVFVPDIEEDDRPREIYVYRAYPVLFDATGTPRAITAAELLGTYWPAPQPPELAAYTRLGYDVTQLQLEKWLGEYWVGRSPLYRNGMGARTTAYSVSALINRYGLLNELTVAYDTALWFGGTQPEIGPYVIVEIWRRETPAA